jgi:S-(hydroxymethyl)glutathione dehydrogenase/alcohol dehydrogenase
VELGAGVTSVAVGDHVIINNIPECGKCPQCLSPSINLCEESGLAQQTTRNPFYNSNYKPFYKSATGEDIRTMITGGTFATHTIIQAHSLTRIPKDFPFEEAALIGIPLILLTSFFYISLCIACGVMTGIGCTQYATKVTPGSTVAVFGMGSIGLNVVQVCFNYLLFP